MIFLNCLLIRQILESGLVVNTADVCLILQKYFCSSVRLPKGLLHTSGTISPKTLAQFHRNRRSPMLS